MLLHTLLAAAFAGLQCTVKLRCRTAGNLCVCKSCWRLSATPPAHPRDVCRDVTELMCSLGMLQSIASTVVVVAHRVVVVGSYAFSAIVYTRV
jgi:hypothetical protein